ncbi:MAG: prohibitin family protein [Candidatus Kapabacteria bacterium]|nr:prohibitin family protein [Candidatus Kapabacteria bacterium]
MRFKFVVSLLFLMVLSISCTTVPAGYRGIKVYLMGSSTGVDAQPLNVGRYFYWPLTQQIFKFPTFQQNVVWEGQEEITFQTIEGLSARAEIGMSYYLVSDSVPVLFQKYRRGIDEITSVYLRNMVIDVLNNLASQMTIESVYGKGRQLLLDKATEMVANQVRPFGIVVERVYSIGEFRLPPAVVTAINLKIEASQRAQQRENEVKEAEAEASKKIAQARGEAESVRIRAEAEATANKSVANSVTPSLIQYQSIKRWDGRLPLVTGGTVPLLNLEQLLKQP